MTFKNTKSDAAPVCRKAWWHLFKTDQFQMQTMIWPGLILCFIFCYIPMYGIIIAFKDYNILSTVTGADWVGLKYFREFFNDPALSNVLRNTLMLNGLDDDDSAGDAGERDVPHFLEASAAVHRGGLIWHHHCFQGLQYPLHRHRSRLGRIKILQRIFQ